MRLYSFAFYLDNDKNEQNTRTNEKKREHKKRNPTTPYPNDFLRRNSIQLAHNALRSVL